MSDKPDPAPLNNGYVSSELVNVEAMRSQAVRKAVRRDGSTLIHYHKHGEPCEGLEHEFIRNIDGTVTKYEARGAWGADD
jgi:hypothetical protein